MSFAQLGHQVLKGNQQDEMEQDLERDMDMDMGRE